MSFNEFCFSFFSIFLFYFYNVTWFIFTSFGCRLCKAANQRPNLHSTILYPQTMQLRMTILPSWCLSTCRRFLSRRGFEIYRSYPSSSTIWRNHSFISYICWLSPSNAFSSIIRRNFNSKAVAKDQPQSKEGSIPKIVSDDSSNSSSKHKKTLTMDIRSMNTIYSQAVGQSSGMGYFWTKNLP